ncbi:hypothetical protein D3C85_638460 [compost metagenome]
MKNYPTIGKPKGLPRPSGLVGPRCEVCRKPALFKVMIEQSLASVDDIGPFRACAIDAHAATAFLDRDKAPA